MVRVTVSGHPGSGTSTLVTALAERYGWSTLNGGQIFREEAARRGLDLGAFGRLCAEDPSVDRELDALLQERMQADGGPDVVESRMAGWWSYRLGLGGLRVWLDVDEHERARRVVMREGGDLESALKANQERRAVDGARFEELYGLQPEDAEPYSHVLDATRLDAAEVLAAVVAMIEEDAA